MQHLSKIAEELDLKTLSKLKKASDDDHTYGLLKDVGAQLGVSMGTGLLGHGYAKAVGSAATDNAGWNNSHPEFIKKIVDYAGLKGFYHNPNSIRQHPTLWDAINHKFGKPYVPKDIPLTPLMSSVNMLNNSFNVPHDAHPGIYAHELGHVLQGRKTQTLTNLLPKVLGNYASLPTAISQDQDTAKNFALAGSALNGVTLANEIDASTRGFRSLRGTGLSNMSKLRSFIGLPTYALSAAVPWLTYKAREAAGAFNKK